MGFSETLTRFPNKKRKKEEVSVEENNPPLFPSEQQCSFCNKKALEKTDEDGLGEKLQSQLMQYLTSSPSHTQALLERLLGNLTYPFYKTQRCCSCVCSVIPPSLFKTTLRAEEILQKGIVHYISKPSCTVTTTRRGLVLLCCTQGHIFDSSLILPLIGTQTRAGTEFKGPHPTQIK